MTELSLSRPFEPGVESEEDYLDELYGAFLRDLVESGLGWRGKACPLSLRREPMVDSRHAVFWHVVSGENEVGIRERDDERCRRLHWIRPMIIQFNNDYPDASSDVIFWWQSTRSGGYPRFLLATRDFSYVVVVEDRSSYALLITAYWVEREHRRVKLQKEHAAFRLTARRT